MVGVGSGTRVEEGVHPVPPLTLQPGDRRFDFLGPRYTRHMENTSTLLTPDLSLKGSQCVVSHHLPLRQGPLDGKNDPRVEDST